MTGNERPSIVCARCGRTPVDVPGAWNMQREDDRTFYLCPDDQTGEDYTEAVMSEAIGVEADDDDPAVLALLPWLREVVTAVFADCEREGSPLNIDMLASRALARILPELGATEADVRDSWRDGLAAMFLDLARGAGHEPPGAD